MIFPTLKKNVRACFRAICLSVFTLGIYVIWLAGDALAADARRWRATVFSRWAKTIARIAGMRIKVRGVPSKSTYILVANHLGYMDVAAFAATLECFFVAKSEVRDWFMIGKLAASMETTFISRQNRRDILRAGDEIRRKLASGESLVLFPEGTSSNGERVLPFKSSFLELAAVENLPVSYASITYRTTDKNANAQEEICWWGDADFLPHLWRLFQIEGFEAIITFGDEPVKNRNRKELAGILQEKVGEIFTPVANSDLDRSN